MQLRHYNAAFQNTLQNLNAAQRTAVDALEGPVMVIAGPGTGKTHILAARIGRILHDTDTQAYNILCLTFTDAGTQAMRQRLLDFIGPEAHKVHIFTFHGFCNKVIQDNLDYFGRYDLSPISDLDRVDIIRKMLDNVGPTHPLKRGMSDPYFYEKSLHGLFQMMKKEAWTAESVREAINDYIAIIPTLPQFIYSRKSGSNQKGDLKTAAIEKKTEQMVRLAAAADLYPTYQKSMHQNRGYDFEDMILWVIKAFQDNPNLLRNYQEQYLYFLVDEYQDTNGAQNQILQLLISYWHNPNVFIVGDDDQSIYEFQGARLKNLTDFATQYLPSLQTIVLSDNYRSSQHILNLAGDLIKNNQQRVVNELSNVIPVNKELLAKNNAFASLTTPPQLIHYPNRLHEEADIISQITALQTAGVSLDEVAIICAQHSYYQNILAIFEKKGIPYTTKRRLNILDLPIIRNLRLLMEYIQQEFSSPYSGEYLVFKIMHFDFWQISTTDLAKISIAMRNQEGVYWRDILLDVDFLNNLHLQNTDNIIALGNFINLLLSDISNLNLVALMERLVNRSGLLQYLQNRPDRILQIQVLNTFFEFIKNESLKNPRLSMPRLLDMLDRMDDNRLLIQINKSNYAAKGVNVMTAHAAKGLEFKYVFLPYCSKEHWESNSANRGRFALPDTLTWSGEEDALEAKRRLFYVAITRAKGYLYISNSATDYAGKALENTQFLDELSDSPSLETTTRIVADELTNDLQWLTLLELDELRIQPLEQQIISELLQDFVLSVSAMNRFLSCPLSFFYENVLRIPSVSSEAAAYGLSMHFAFSQLFEKMQRNRSKIFPSKNQFIGFFEQEMKRQQVYFKAKEYERRLAMGRLHLTTIYDQQSSTWLKNTEVEKLLNNVIIEGVPLTGILDMLETQANGELHLVDYKTGSHDDKKLKRPTDSNPNGGQYWRQLVFYKLLYENHRATNSHIHKATIAYLEPDAKGHFPSKTIHIGPEDTALVRDMIQRTYQQIQAQEFYIGCGEKYCEWCNFHRYQTHLDIGRNQDIEELDDNR